MGLILNHVGLPHVHVLAAGPSKGCILESYKYMLGILHSVQLWMGFLVDL